jgi:peptidoglycan/xylan/chitin deacetylase (PgdA/CDA1 family)
MSRMHIIDRKRFRAVADIVRNNTGSGIRVLCYHTIIKDWVDKRVQWPIATTLEAFERHMRHLKTHADIVSIDDLQTILLQGPKYRDRAVAVTFDDGYRSNYELAWPLMKSLGLPMSIFVCTGFMDGHRWMPAFIVHCAVHHLTAKKLALPATALNYHLETDSQKEAAEEDLSRFIKNSNTRKVDALMTDLHAAFPQDQWEECFSLFTSDRLMSWDEVSQIYREGVVIGAHTHNHAMVSQCTTETEFEEELKRPLALLKERGIICRHLAYPNGKRNNIGETALNYTRNCGYTSAFTTIPGRIKDWCNPLYLPRISGQIESLDAFIRNLNRTWFDILWSEWRR